VNKIYFRIAQIVAMIVAMGSAGSAAAVDVGWAAKVGLDFGGDTLRNVQFTDGSTSNIKANEGLYVGVGMSLLNEEKTLEVELTANWKYDGIEATNGSISWTRWPIDALFFYRTEQIRVGGGLTYHMNPKLEVSGAAPGNNVDMENSLGKVLQFEYRFGEHGSVGARYTMLEYDVQGSTAVKSNGLGIVVTGRF